MKTDYKNWIPTWMLAALLAAVFVLTILSCLAVFTSRLDGWHRILLFALTAAAWLMMVWCGKAYRDFSYQGGRRISQKIIGEIASHAHIPDGGIGLDVGCGSGALTIACAKNNPRAQMLGIDHWGLDYPEFSEELCRRNAKAEGVGNVSFQKGDARKLPFADESFDFVSSNYVYHNIPGNKKKYLMETLRVLKKGGTFAIHDIMNPKYYGEAQNFARELVDSGFERAECINITRKFMTDKEEKILGLKNSWLLIGRK